MSEVQVAYIGAIADAPGYAQVAYIGASAVNLVADTGPDVTVRPGDTVPLLPVGRVGTFTQDSGPSVTITGTPPFQSYVAPMLLAGATLVFELEVTDGVNTATDIVTHTVLPHQSWQVVDGVLIPIRRFA